MQISRRQVWMVELPEERKGHEQRGSRPAVVISDDIYNNGPAGMVIVLPVTSRDTGIPYHIPIPPKEGGLEKRSFIICDQLQSISTSRLIDPRGTISRTTMERAEHILKALIFPPRTY
ncbi:MAG: type II toxin-antitoxin system PemK/MazF family toxin [Actinobacteria bacterium]|nr:type II toxin-antitoxin system PemK/MazF family toxin [Actinomycetota bacterium]MBU1944463.1 type II toxin-antitoxin system PemK/MazF family toxin [Actinomycetota bacterium]MBU2688628.1 type II toxin-antitoxin system PemK/MazF family toxin [Actinomycetota bacterium]